MSLGWQPFVKVMRFSAMGVLKTGNFMLSNNMTGIGIREENQQEPSKVARNPL